MFFVVRLNNSFNFPLGWMKYIVTVNSAGSFPLVWGSVWIFSHRCFGFFIWIMLNTFPWCECPFWVFSEALGTTWTKFYCQYKKETKEFYMILYNQIGGKVVSVQFPQFYLDILWIWVLTFIVWWFDNCGHWGNGKVLILGFKLGYTSSALSWLWRVIWWVGQYFWFCTWGWKMGL